MEYRIAVAGTGYVGLSLAVLLSQHNEVTAVDIVKEKTDKINRFESPIVDEYIDKFFAEAREGNRHLNLKATTDGDEAYSTADFIIIATPTNYDSKQNYFDTSAVESVIEQVLKTGSKAEIIIKSTIPVGYTESVRKKYSEGRFSFPRRRTFPVEPTVW